MLGIKLEARFSDVSYKRPHAPSARHYGLCPKAVHLPHFFSSQPALKWPLGSFRDRPLGNSAWTPNLLSGLARDYGWERREEDLHGAEDIGRRDCCCGSLV